MIKVSIEEEINSELLVGDLFLEVHTDSYFIFCKMHDMKYALMPLTLNMNDAGVLYTSYEDANIDLTKCLSDGSFIKFKSEIYELELNLKLKGSN